MERGAAGAQDVEGELWQSLQAEQRAQRASEGGVRVSSSPPDEAPDAAMEESLEDGRQGEGVEHETVTLAKRESIYGFMLLYPELCRVKYGTYCHPQVCLAAFIFFLNIVLQVSLTHITGMAIMQKNMDYRHSLLVEPGGPQDDTLWGPSVGDSPFFHWENQQEDGQCCRGHQCHQGVSSCCPPRRPGLVQLHSHSESGARRAGRRSPESGQLAASARGSPQLAAKPAGSDAAAAKKENLLKPGEGTHKSPSLCQKKNGTIDCSQPSFAILDKWSQLDFNGDGLWSREEALRDDANLACQIHKGITIEQTFNAIVRGLTGHIHGLIEQGILTEAEYPAELRNRSAVPESFFDLWRGITVVCSVRDSNRCGQLIQDGIFDGALDGTHGAKDGIFLLEHALDFCQKLLETGGTCESSHPVTYLMWRQHTEQMCGAPLFNGGRFYRNPHKESDGLDLLFVEYTNIAQFAMANSTRFQFFVCLILFVWYVNLLREFNDTIDLIDFVVHFPTCYQDPFDTKGMLARIRTTSRGIMHGHTTAKEGLLDMISPDVAEIVDGELEIKKVSYLHKGTLWAMIVVRIFLLFYMLVVGTIFILTTYSFIDLLMNAVALAFVFELPEFLYTLLVGNREKAELDNIAEPEYKTSFPKGKGLVGLLQSNIFWGLVIFPLLAFGIVWWNAYTNTGPIYEALMCACFQKGEGCLTSSTLSREWWNEHWSHSLASAA